MRKTGLNEIFELAKNYRDVYFIGSDLGHETLKDYRLQLPNQFSMEGISESHIVSMASGMAQEGYTVYINTIANFFTRRAYEQILLDICNENLPVIIYGNGGGLVYGPLGHTHTAIDDFSLFYSIDNMTVLAPCDAIEMKKFIVQSYELKAPVYIRLGKGGDPIVSKNFNSIIGKADYIKNDNDNKRLICTTGVMLQRSIEVASKVEDIDILHFGTIQPFDSNSLKEYLPKYDEIIVIEEHLAQGGLATRIQEVMCHEQICKKITKINIGKSFVNIYGRQEELFEELGLSVTKIIERIK